MALALVLLLAAPDTAFEHLRSVYAEAVREADWDGMEQALDGIARTGDDRAVPFLEEQLRAAGTRRQRRLVFRTLAALDWPGRPGLLVRHARAKDPFERALAVAALVEVDRREARRQAARLVRDEDESVRRQAAHVFARLDDAGAANTLVREAARLPAEEQAAFLDLVGGMGAGALGGVEHLVEHPEREVRAAAVRVLAAHATSASRPALERARRDSDGHVALLACAGLDRLSGSEVSSIARRLAKARKFDERWELCDLVCRTRLRDPALAIELTALARRGGPLRPKAAEALGHAGRASAVPVLAALLDERKPWQLPIGAARGLAATRARDAIPVLLAALPATTGRLAHEVARALESLTGQHFDTAAFAWRRWWKDHVATFRVPEIPPPFWEDKERTDRYAFYGVPVHSEAVVFVCDVSTSMAGAPIRTLKRQLRAVVQRYPERGRFNLVFFGAEPDPWAPKLRLAAAKTKERALAFVGRQDPRGGSNLWGALEAALKDPAVDTVVILTDGLPNTGRVPHVSEIRRRFERRNRARMVVLHVICIGMRSSDLRAMARASGGRYVER